MAIIRGVAAYKRVNVDAKHVIPACSYPIRILAFFLSDTAVLRFDTDFNKIYGVIIFIHIIACMRDNTILHNGIIVYCY